ncbi:MAG: hypothetical protein A3I83_08205 [Methylotenera sp. RIFCSPLOWO2_02_FULL_45_14]|nr:MAG: hypothetical protein A3I83_08205 [Methylotenera sp. RIFCSPLOWO2_02_FULL_45_14]
MYRMLIVVPLTALLLNACVVSPAGHGRGHGMVVVPALPVIVELDVEPYYYQGGYYYFYDNDSWRYSQSRSGPWTDLPRSHYPKETKFKGRAGGRGGNQDNDRHDRR